MAKTEYGIQMYSVRDISKDDLKGSLEAVAKLGYKYIEFAGFFEKPAKDVKAWLDEYGLICPSTHTGLGLLTKENIENLIEYHHTIGADRLVIPSGTWKAEENMKFNVETINMAAPILKKEGITLAYHNHSWEYKKTEYGKVPMQILEEECPDIEFELDVFWAFNAGIDPLAEIDRLKSRMNIIHLKDGIPEEGDNKAVGTSIGEGVTPIKAIREKALDLELLMIVESEGLNPTGLEEVERCIKYLRTLD